MRHFIGIVVRHSEPRRFPYVVNLVLLTVSRRGKQDGAFVSNTKALLDPTGPFSIQR